MREDLLQLKNISDASAHWLIAIGIDSVSEIEDLGAAAEVYRRLRARFPVSRNMLWALQGALMDLPYNRLPPTPNRPCLTDCRASRLLARVLPQLSALHKGDCRSL